MKYVHKSLRPGTTPPPKSTAPTSLRAAPAVDPAPPAPAATTAPAAPPPGVSRALFDATWAVVLGHRQFIRAGVPGCSCGVTFASHATFVADHTEHLSCEVVTHVLTFLLRAAEGQDQDMTATVELLRSMLAADAVLEGAPA